MSPRYNKVKSFYDMGLWSKTMVRNAVVKQWISADEYKEIVGEDY